MNKNELKAMLSIVKKLGWNDRPAATVIKGFVDFIDFTQGCARRKGGETPSGEKILNDLLITL